MTELERALELVAALTVSDKQAVLRYLRQSLPPHPMEERLRASSETLLEAIGRASPLTIRGIEGILAEASFATEVLPQLTGWSTSVASDDAAYDFLVGETGNPATVRVQVKMQRRRRHQPWMANEALKSTRSWPADHYLVEVQRTRGGTDGSGARTRPYRFGSFDILAVSLGAARGRWHHFAYTVANWLIPDPNDQSIILKYQPVAPGENEDWTSDFLKAVGWHRSGINKTIAG